MPPKKAPTKPTSKSTAVKTAAKPTAKSGATGGKGVKGATKKATTGPSGVNAGATGKSVENKTQGAGAEPLPGLEIVMRELDDVLLRDVGNKIQESGKWPLIIDTSGGAATFLRYRDTNYLQGLSPTEMESERIRLALLGALRYGKPLVLDMLQVDMFDTCTERFNSVMEGLMEAIMTKAIMKEDVYTKLLRETDGEEYHINQFNDSRTQNFKFFIITQNPYPPQELLEKTYVIRIKIPT